MKPIGNSVVPVIGKGKFNVVCTCLQSIFRKCDLLFGVAVAALKEFVIKYSFTVENDLHSRPFRLGKVHTEPVVKVVVLCGIVTKGRNNIKAVGSSQEGRFENNLAFELFAFHNEHQVGDLLVAEGNIRCKLRKIERAFRNVNCLDPIRRELGLLVQ